jgi:hypothetical protein
VGIFYLYEINHGALAEVKAVLWVSTGAIAIGRPTFAVYRNRLLPRQKGFPVRKGRVLRLSSTRSFPLLRKVNA